MMFFKIVTVIVGELNPESVTKPTVTACAKKDTVARDVIVASTATLDIQIANLAIVAPSVHHLLDVTLLENVPVSRISLEKLAINAVLDITNFQIV